MAVSIGNYGDDVVLDVFVNWCGDCGKGVTFADPAWLEAVDLCSECLAAHKAAAPCWCLACRISATS